MNFKAMVAALALLGAMPATSAHAAGVEGPTAWDGISKADVRGSYRDNLVRCISHSPRCDKQALSPEDKDYLLYELKSQRFDADTVQQVTDVRMEVFDKPVATLQGKATGSWSTQAASTDRVAPETGQYKGPQGPMGLNLGNLGVSQEMVEAGAGMLRSLGTAIN